MDKQLIAAAIESFLVLQLIYQISEIYASLFVWTEVLLRERTRLQFSLFLAG